MALLILAVAGIFASSARAQFSSYDLYTRQYHNTVGVADTLYERLLAQRQAIRAGYDVQALETAVDPSTYKLGPGDGVYLNVYASHALDQDLTVTPEGRLLVPRVGQIDVAGLVVTEAEKKVNTLLAKDYKNPQAALSLRKLRPIKLNVLGEVVMPGILTATSLQRLSEVIDKSGGFRERSSLRNIEIRRTDGSLRGVGDLVKYYATGDLESNPVLESGDVVLVPRVNRFVTINGAVNKPGQIEFKEGDDLASLIQIAHGLSASAQPDSVEIARYSTGDPTQAKRFYVNFTNKENPKLNEGDIIFIRSIPQYHLPRVVSIAGEVTYPGRYAIELGETRLSDVLRRSGGFLQTSSAEEAVLIRRTGIGSWESEPELIRLGNLGQLNKERMTDDEYNYYVARMRQMGRTIMVVDFQKLLSGDREQDLLLREEDSIWVPRARGYVNVTGAVNYQGNVLFEEGRNYEYYIQKAGGFSSSGDPSGVRVINAKTSSYIDPTTDKRYRIGPGDVIVIPPEKSEFWKNFQTVATIASSVLTIVAGVLILLPRKS